MECIGQSIRFRGINGISWLHNLFLCVATYCYNVIYKRNRNENAWLRRKLVTSTICLLSIILFNYEETLSLPTSLRTEINLFLFFSLSFSKEKDLTRMKLIPRLNRRNRSWLTSLPNEFLKRNVHGRSWGKESKRGICLPWN